MIRGCRVLGRDNRGGGKVHEFALAKFDVVAGQSERERGRVAVRVVAKARC